MTDSMTNQITCPLGHRFPRDQLTIREGQYVCPVCERMDWAAPTSKRRWSRSMLRTPLVLLVIVLGVYVLEQACLIGLGTSYLNEKADGAGWLVIQAVVTIVGIIVIGAGVARMATLMSSDRFDQPDLAPAFFTIGIGASLFALGDLCGLGFDANLVNAAVQGAGWQLAAQIFDAFFFAGLAMVAFWLAQVMRTTTSGQSDGPVGSLAPGEGTGLLSRSTYRSEQVVTSVPPTPMPGPPTEAPAPPVAAPPTTTTP